MITAQAPVPPPTQNCGTFDLSCQVGKATTSALDSLVDLVARGTADLVVAMSTWWVKTDSINPQDSAVLVAQGATRELVLLILVASVLVQAIRLILSRKAEPLIMVATGLLRFAVVSALGLVVLQSALRAGDAFAAQLLNGAANNFALLMRDLLTQDHTGVGSFVVFLVSLVAAVASLAQWLFMAIRQAGLLVMAAMLPLAASGSLTRTTRSWLDRLMAWLIAIVVYKPAAAFIYYIGFTYLSSPSSNEPGGISTLLTGCVVLILAVIALPVLLKFFSWSGLQISGSGGGGSGLLGAAGAVAMSRSYRGSQAVSRAASTERSGPGSAGPTPPSGAAPAAGRTSTAASSGAAGGAAAGVAGAAVTAAVAAKAAVKGVGDHMTGGGPR